MRSIVPSPPSEITRSSPSVNGVDVERRGARGPTPRRRRAGIAHRDAVLGERGGRVLRQLGRVAALAVRDEPDCAQRAHAATPGVAPGSRGRRDDRVQRRRRRRASPGRAAAARPDVEEELDVAVGAAQRRRDHVDDDQAVRREPVARPRAAPRGAPRDRGRSRPCRPGRVPPRTAASPAARARRRASAQRASAGATVSSEMKERSATTRSTGAADVGRLEVADVGALQHRDPRVGAQRPRELAAADVDRDHLRPPRLQEAVGEPAGRRAGVERPAPVDAPPRTPSSAAASLSPPRDTKRGPSPVDRDRLAGSTRRAGDVGAAARRRAPARRRSPRPPAPAGEQAPAHQLGVEPSPHGHRRRIGGGPVAHR